MKTFYLLISSILITSSVHSQSLQSLDSAQYFDFWVGEWVASWDEGNGVEELGANNITKGLDGKVIIENFRITLGKSAGFKGMSMSVYQPQFGRWKQSWTDNQGGYFDFSGAFEGEERIFQTEVFERGGKQVQQRMVFRDIQSDSMTWDWERSVDGGNTWSLNWRIYYKRLSD